METGGVTLDSNGHSGPRSENGVAGTKFGMMSSSFESKRTGVSFGQIEEDFDKPKKGKLPKDAADVREMSAQIVADVLARSVLEHLVVNQKRFGLNAEALTAARAAALWAANRPAAPSLQNPEAAAWEVIQAAEKASNVSRPAAVLSTLSKKDEKSNGKNGLAVTNGRTKEKENVTRPKKARSKTCVIL
ncbi:uncharacterized protein LOC118415869 [Branchiostoma floridae]|nr:uncharacterized protein LOC118415869 [Branchiostoma floridae]XP_035676618.1 uncharacterized protein LOC118415869 [Branchiostoma floridae]